jgi:hypothetical protein
MTSKIAFLAETFFIRETNSESIDLNLVYSFDSYYLISDDPKKILSK